MIHYSLQSEPFHILFRILQDNDGATAVPVCTHIYTPSMFDDSGCTATVVATGDCNATANI